MVWIRPFFNTFSTRPMWLFSKITSAPTCGVWENRWFFLNQSRVWKTFALAGKIDVGMPARWKHHHWNTTHHAPTRGSSPALRWIGWP